MIGEETLNHVVVHFVFEVGVALEDASLVGTTALRNAQHTIPAVMVDHARCDLWGALAKTQRIWGRAIANTSLVQSIEQVGGGGVHLVS
jgi:hypothetical protein